MNDVRIRPLEADDVEAVREVQTRAFDELDRAAGEPPYEMTDAAKQRQRWRVQHFLTHDPEGSWVATLDGQVVGTALALRRASYWGLSLLVVSPEHQSRGIGRLLLDASLAYADGVERAIILSSQDPRAMRRYATAGFELFPQVRAKGVIDRALLRTPDLPVRPGSLDDAAFADSVDIVVRGAPRGVDHEVILRTAAMYVVDDGSRRGYAYIRSDGRLVTVAANDPSAATALLWSCLAHPCAGDERTIDHLTGEQQWAIRVALQARLALAPMGPVFWRGATPPYHYLPDGAYL